MKSNSRNKRQKSRNVILEYVERELKREGKNSKNFRLCKNLLDDLKKEVNPPHLICLASGSFRWVDNHIEGSVNISGPKGFIITTKPTGRSVFEGAIIDDKEGLLSLNIPDESRIKNFLERKEKRLRMEAFRWAAGGTIPVLEFKKGRKEGKKYVVFARRDWGAPVHQGYLTTFSGLSRTIEELMQPELMIARGLFDELLIFDAHLKKRYRTDFSKCNFRDGMEYYDLCDKKGSYLYKFNNLEDIENSDVKYRKRYERILNNLGIEEPEAVETPACPVKLDSDSIEYFQSKSTKGITLKGSIAIDPVHGALDIIGSVLLQLEVSSPEELRLVSFDKDGEKLLFRDIVLVDGENLKKLINGSKCEAFVYTNNATDVDGVSTEIQAVNEEKIGRPSVSLVGPLKVVLEKPALTPPLRQSLVGCYRTFFLEDLEFGYVFKEGRLVDRPFKEEVTE